MALSVANKCKGLSLWPHQLKALETISKYRASGSDRAALIRLPTGTGKTGVMAVATRVLETEATLIVAPWSFLTSQLKRDIQLRFWRRIGVQPPDSNRPVVTFTPATATKAVEAATSKAATLICTNHTLQQLSSANPSVYSQLRSAINLVLVDEGHREPAPEWGKAVRGLGMPTVLLTATPFRNDYRYFNLDTVAAYRLPFAEAVATRFLRDCTFVEADYPRNPSDFVDALLKVYNSKRSGLKKSVGEDPRVIVRCGTDTAIREVAKLLNARGHSVVAVHDELGGSEVPWEHGDVPDPDTTDATFWVHQNKLIEGVDDPRFAILALYTPFGNARALVQQIGRVLRNPTRIAGAKAIVFTHKSDQQMRVWESYKRYEDRLGNGAKDAGPVEVFNNLLLLQESHQYLEGNFRERFDPTAADVHEHLRYPRSVTVFTCGEDFSLSSCLAAIRDRIEQDDHVALGSSTAGPDVHVVAYGRCAASPLLLDQTFMELTFGFCIVRQVGKLLFYYDSEGMTPDYLDIAARRIAPNALERLLADDGARVSQVSLLNSDIGAYSIRRRILSARAMDQIAPSLSDSAHFCSTTIASVPANGGAAVRRYLGFTRGRLSQPSGGMVSCKEWLAWTDEVATVLARPTAPPPAFLARYAAYTPSPVAPSALHILIDIDEALDEVTSADSIGEQLLLEDRAWDVVDGKFSWTIGGKAYDVKVMFRNGRFELDSPALADAIVTKNAQSQRSRNLVSHLNIEQALRIVTDKGLIYSSGQFYQPRIPLWGPKATGGLELLKVIIGCPGLSGVESEKGTGSGSIKTWPKKSLFEFIDRRKPDGLLGLQALKPDLLVCDDLGNEVADFVAVQRVAPRVALIHAKSGKAGQTLSASAFHEVCSQAVKNLGVLSPHFPSKLKSPALWNNAWKQKGGFSVTSRIRVPAKDMTGAKAWDLIQETVRTPSTSREVWIVMGHGMSRSELETEWKQVNPKPHVIQMIYLLQATWNAVSSMGALLRVFCKP